MVWPALICASTVSRSWGGMAATSAFTRSACCALAASLARILTSISGFAQGTTSAHRSPSRASRTSMTLNVNGFGRMSICSTWVGWTG